MKDLTTRFVEGEPQAMADVYAKHASLVYSFASRTLDAETAREVTQDVFVSAWKSRDRFDSERASLRTWLMAIAKNRVVDVYRHRSRRPVSVETEPEQLESLPEETAQVERIADRMTLAQAIGGLPERAQKIVELSFFHQLTHSEISDETGIPLGTVKSDLRRSISKLQTLLVEQGAITNV